MKIIEVLKHVLEDDKSFVGRVKEVWILHVHDTRNYVIIRFSRLSRS